MSDITEAIEARILLAWQAGEVSEGLASKALGVSRVEAREALQGAINMGRIFVLNRTGRIAEEPEL